MYRNKKGLSFSPLLYKYNANNRQACKHGSGREKKSRFVDIKAGDKREKGPRLVAGLIILSFNIVLIFCVPCIFYLFSLSSSAFSYHIVTKIMDEAILLHFNLAFKKTKKSWLFFIWLYTSSCCLLVEVDYSWTGLRMLGEIFVTCFMSLSV